MIETFFVALGITDWESAELIIPKVRYRWEVKRLERLYKGASLSFSGNLVAFFSQIARHLRNVTKRRPISWQTLETSGKSGS
jgi:hypothetical protein